MPEAHRLWLMLAAMGWTVAFATFAIAYLTDSHPATGARLTFRDGGSDQHVQEHGERRNRAVRRAAE